MREDISIPANVLTFEELRTIQKRGRTSDSLQNLGASFLDRVAEYLKLKKKLSDKLSAKEYENAIRVIADILELRERKLVRLAALSAKTKIPIKNVSDAEKKFLNSLKKVFEKHHSFLDNKLGFESADEEEEIEDETEIESPVKPIERFEKDIEQNEVVETEVPKKMEPKTTETPKKDHLKEPETPKIEEKIENKPKKEENLLFKSGEEKDDEIKENEKKPKEETPKKTVKEENSSSKNKIRLKATVPKFLGVDLEVYGPFKEGDEAELPPKNAEVLINQGVAEPIKNVISSA